MLNKLAHFKNQSNSLFETGKAAAAAAFLSASGQEYSLEATNQGTLGLTFLCDGKDGGSYFVKTHLPGSTLHRTTLLHEFRLLSLAHGADLSFLRCITGEVDGCEQLYVLMDALQPVSDVTPGQCRALISAWPPDLAASLTIPSYGLEALLDAALVELQVQRDAGLLSAQLLQFSLQRLQLLTDRLPYLPRCVCHGDLSDRNIMRTHSGAMVAIDWEDAFWGIPDYDYLYWLTFFNHRKYYSPEIFQTELLDPPLRQAVLILILTIKNAISYYNGTFQTNSLSMEGRILEILHYTGGLSLG